MGSESVQGQLWGNRASEFANYLEQLTLPLFGAVLDAARVTRGTRTLDAGCGAGLLALLASFRDARWMRRRRCSRSRGTDCPTVPMCDRATWRRCRLMMRASTR